MEDRSSSTTEPMPARHDPVTEREDFAQDALNDRIRRLEDAIAALQDTRTLEDRVLNRVTETIKPRAAENAFQRFDGDRRPAAPSAAAHPVLPLPPLPQIRSLTPVIARSGFMIFELIGEIGTFARMFFDVRYRVTWTTWLITVVGLSFVLLSHLFVPFTGIPILGAVFDKILDLFLVLFVYKILSLEAQRYRETLAAYQQAYR